MSRNAFYYITQANKSSPTNYNKMFDCLNISTNVGVLIPNPASVFVLDVRISRKIELKLAKKKTLGGPGLPIWLVLQLNLF